MQAAAKARHGLTALQEKIEAMISDEQQQCQLDMEMEVERLRAMEAYQASWMPSTDYLRMAPA